MSSPPAPGPGSAQLTVPQEMGGVRAGVIVFAGIASANLGNYVFHLVSARYLGPDEYGDVATLAALTGLVGLPLAGVQVVVARHTARLVARERREEVADFARRALALAALAGIALTTFGLALAPFVQRALSIGSAWAVVFTALFTLTAFVSPVVWGLAQGLQRFDVFALSLGAGPIFRIAIVVATFAAGWGVTGALGATFFAAVIGVAVPLLALREFFLVDRKIRLHAGRAQVMAVMPVLGGLLAITALSTDDLLVAKSTFAGETAGIYGSASLIGKVILYLPAAIVTVLLPKVSARQAMSRDTTNILSASVVVTACFCAVAIAAYALVPDFIVGLAFGDEFDRAAGLLWMFGLSMSGFAILNVVLAYHLGRGSTALSWLLLAGAILQAVGFAFFHATPRELLSVNIATSGLLLIAHELLIDHTLLRTALFAVQAIRSGRRSAFWSRA